MTLAAATLLGLALGLKHAFEADHVAAVCSLVARGGGVGRAAETGALWGFGHGAVIVLAGGALVAVGVTVPASVALVLDIAVALMLVWLGIAALLSGRRPAQSERQPAEYRRKRPFAVGLVHGASGTAALTLLVASTIPTRLHAMAFLAVFAMASVAAMAAAAALVAWPLRSAASRAPALVVGFQRVAGAGSIVAGIAIAWAAVGVGAVS